MTLYSVTATYNHPEAASAYDGCYSYDDPKFYVIAEPLVHDCTQAIICAMASADMCYTITPPPKITIDFTNNTFLKGVFSDTDLVLELTYDSYSDDDFNMYQSEVISPSNAVVNSLLADDLVESPLVPLCNHIMDYFLTPPEKLWVRISVPEPS